MDPHRLRTDADYRRAQEDWLDHEENLGRSAADVAGTDLVFIAGMSIVTVAVVLFIRRLIVRR